MMKTTNVGSFPAEFQSALVAGQLGLRLALRETLQVRGAAL